MGAELESFTPVWWDAQTRKTHRQTEARRQKQGWSCGCSLCRELVTVKIEYKVDAGDWIELGKVPVSLPQSSAGQETPVKHPQGKRHQRELEAVADWLREREGWSIRKLVKGLKEERGIEVSTATVWRWLKKEGRLPLQDLSGDYSTQFPFPSAHPSDVLPEKGECRNAGNTSYCDNASGSIPL